MTTQPAKKAAGTIAKKAAHSANGVKKSAGDAKKAARTVTNPVKSTRAGLNHLDHDDPRPLEGYAALLISYGILSGVLTLGLRRKGVRVKALGPVDLLLYGLATEHLSRTLTKDSVTAVLRSPFTRFKEPAGEGEVNEEVIGEGVRHALGELLTCPFCAAEWVATGLVAGSVVAPSLTTALISVSAAARASDYLSLLYGLLRKEQ